MKLNSVQNNYNFPKGESKVNFTSMPSGENCTRIFRADTQWKHLTPFVLNHFQNELSQLKAKIKVVSHFCSDCSELYSFIFALIRSIGYENVVKHFSFEARDINPQIVKTVKDKKIMVIKKTADGGKTDIDRLKENIGLSIKLKGQKLSIKDLFEPVDKEIKDESSQYFGFQKCQVHDFLANLVNVKHENIKNFSGDEYNIIFVRNNLSGLGKNALDGEFAGLFPTLHEKAASNGIVIASQYDVNRFGINEKFMKIFSSSYDKSKGDMIYIK